MIVSTILYTMTHPYFNSFFLLHNIDIHNLYKEYFMSNTGDIIMFHYTENVPFAWEENPVYGILAVCGGGADTGRTAYVIMQIQHHECFIDPLLSVKSYNSSLLSCLTLFRTTRWDSVRLRSRITKSLRTNPHPLAV